MVKPLSPAQTIAKAQAKAAREHLELAYQALILCAGLPSPIRQHKACPPDGWVWDFAWPECKILVECNGGIYRAKGAHNTGPALIRDYQKGNAANLAGWTCLTFTMADIRSGYALETTREALRLHPPF